MDFSDEIELKLRPHDYAWGHVLHQWLLPLRTPKAWGFVALALIGGLWLNASLDQTRPLKSYILAFAVLIPAWLTKEYLLVYHHYRRASQPSCRIQLTEHGLHYRYAGFDHLYAWSEIRAITRAGRLTFLRVGGRRFLILARAGFTSAQHYEDWQSRVQAALVT